MAAAAALSLAGPEVAAAAAQHHAIVSRAPCPATLNPCSMGTWRHSYGCSMHLEKGRMERRRTWRHIVDRHPRYLPTVLDTTAYSRVLVLVQQRGEGS